MQLNQNSKDSLGQCVKTGLKMKIALFIKPSVLRVYFSFLLLIFIFAQPSQANAGFFSNLVNKVVGTEAQANAPESVKSEVIYNSQNVPLLESSINPDLKNIKTEIPAIKDGSLLSNDGDLGIDSELEKYDPDVKISTYTVVKGDTLEGIAKKLNVSKASIIESNTDLKENDLIKVGESLVIFGLKADKVKELAKKAPTKVGVTTEVGKEKVVKAPEPKKEAPAPIQAPVVVQDPVVATPQIEAPASIAVQQPDEVSTPTGQPEGNMADDKYIWPFPKGVGRISQGLHADQAYDFAAPIGTPIYAVQSGTVVVAKPSGYNGGYGLYVVINFDDGRQAIFGHMSKVLAKAGQVVKRGDVIGYVGSTGKSTGPHLHLGFRGELRNPYIGLKVNDKDIKNYE